MGDEAAGEWRRWTPAPVGLAGAPPVLHVRRRLTAAEQDRTGGPPVDIRKSEEAERRLRAVADTTGWQIEVLRRFEAGTGLARIPPCYQ